HIYFNWWHALFWAAGLGLAAWRFFRKKLNFQQIQYIIIFGLVSFWLIVVYGSWNFFDNIDPTKITIGNSYLRYWLPSFVLATPIIALAGVALNKFLKTLSLKIVWLVFFFMLFSILGVWTCFYGEDEGLVHVRANLWRYESIAESVLELTPDDAIIITDRSDKIFFPYRRVVCGFENPDVQDALETMYFLAPLYYYGVTFPHEDLIRLNEDTFAPNNLQLRRLESFDNESLYIFDYIKDETSA
ncbi:hypothetical protein KJ969_03935, partial [Patescibacteria group bacterium]|nr:hypothetical protein [Patescibacteria group bacterium]MBU1921815.1 hypothetical protein [Patescibacteria group bacterium]